MSKIIYIATTEAYSGKSLVVLGIVNMLLGKAFKVGYFKPIIDEDPSGKRDVDIETMLKHFSLDIPYEDTFAFSRHQAMTHLEEDTRGDLIDTIIRKVKILEESHDFTVIEGSDYLGEGAAFEFETNITIAKNLNAPAIFVISGAGKTTDQILGTVQTALRNFNARDVEVLAVIINKVGREKVDEIKKVLEAHNTNRAILAVIPYLKDLQNPTMKEIFAQLGGRLISGETQLSNQVDNFITGAMQLPSFLNYITENVLIVTPGDRADIIIGTLQANQSLNYPRAAGIVLTADMMPDQSVLKLIEGLPNSIPIILVPGNTFITTTQLGSIHSRLTADNTKKLELAIATFEKYVDMTTLEERIITFVPEGITPHMFQYQLVKRARTAIKHIVLAEGNDERILKAAARLINQEIVQLTLLGDPSEVAASIKQLGLNLDLQKVSIIDPIHDPRFNDYVETLYELRKHKNVTLAMAHDLMTDVSYFGTMMVYKGHADGMVSGAVHTTQHTIRPALQFIKTKPGISIVSSVFFMCLPDRVSVFGDCAVNPDPTAEQLAEIAISSAESSLKFGIEPRIAMLSYSSGSSGEGADVEKVRQATALVKQKRPDLKIEGPIQYDAAVDPVVGAQKLPGSQVAGQASVLIFPDLNTGNNTYKAVQRETGALAIGPMLQGLKKPINDLSRGCTVDDVFNTVLITAIQAQEN